MPKGNGWLVGLCVESLDVLLLFHLAPDARHGGLEVGSAEVAVVVVVVIERGRGRRRGSLEPDAPLPPILVVLLVVVIVDRPLGFRRGIRRAPGSAPVSRIGGYCMSIVFNVVIISSLCMLIGLNCSVYLVYSVITWLLARGHGKLLHKQIATTKYKDIISLGHAATFPLPPPLGSPECLLSAPSPSCCRSCLCCRLCLCFRRHLKGLKVKS